MSEALSHGPDTPSSSVTGNSINDGVSTDKPAPVFLPVGAAVSAKYRGAYCEARIERVDLNFRLRVQLKDSKKTVSVNKSGYVSGSIEPNSEVMILISDENTSSTSQAATIVRITDHSLYTVIFDDDDRRSLKRTQLVLKGERHFKESESLDRLPLTNPEQFKQPVIDRNRKYRSSSSEMDDKRGGNSEGDGDTTLVAESSIPAENYSDIDASTNRLPRKPRNYRQGATLTGRKLSSGGKSSVIPITSTPAKAKTDSKLHEMPTLDNGNGKETLSSTQPNLSDSAKPIAYQSVLGSLVMVDMPLGFKTEPLLSPSAGASGLGWSTLSESSSATPSRRRFTPGIVVLPSAMPSIDLKAAQLSVHEPAFLVRSFRENRYYAVPQTYLQVLSRAKAVNLAHRNPGLRLAFERAILWLDRRELPASWGVDAETLLGPNWCSPGSSDAETNIPRKLSSPRKSGANRASKKSISHRSSTKRLPRRASSRGSSCDSGSFLSSSNEDDNKDRKIRLHRRQRRRKSIASTAASSSGGEGDNVVVVVKKGAQQAKRRSNMCARKRTITPRQTDNFTKKLKRGQKAFEAGKLRSRKVRRIGYSSASMSECADSSDVGSESGSLEKFASISGTGSDDSDTESNSSSDFSDSAANFEARDRWIAHLYRFMDERGTPINKAPSIANKDLNLYKLYKIVTRLGGFHRVTSQLKWGVVYSEMDLPHNFTAGPRNLQTAFKKYLFPLDDLSRKLGTDLDQIPLSGPRNQHLKTSIVARSQLPNKQVARSSGVVASPVVGTSTTLSMQQSSDPSTTSGKPRATEKTALSTSLPTLASTTPSKTTIASPCTHATGVIATPAKRFLESTMRRCAEGTPRKDSSKKPKDEKMSTETKLAETKSKPKILNSSSVKKAPSLSAAVVGPSSNLQLAVSTDAAPRAHQSSTSTPIKSNFESKLKPSMSAETPSPKVLTLNSVTTATTASAIATTKQQQSTRDKKADTNQSVKTPPNLVDTKIRSEKSAALYCIKKLAAGLQSPSKAVNQTHARCQKSVSSSSSSSSKSRSNCDSKLKKMSSIEISKAATQLRSETIKEPLSTCSSPALSSFDKSDDFGSLPSTVSKSSRGKTILISVGSHVRVRYGGKSYPAKIVNHVRPGSVERLKICGRIGSGSTDNGQVSDQGTGARDTSSSSSSASISEVHYHVHYMGWNCRHDEIVSRERICQVVKRAPPMDVQRSPSCSALNLIPGRAASMPDSSRTPTSDSMKEKQAQLDEEDIADDDDDDDDDDAEDRRHIDDTASDNITTTAPMVRRRLKRSRFSNVYSDTIITNRKSLKVACDAVSRKLSDRGKKQQAEPLPSAKKRRNMDSKTPVKFTQSSPKEINAATLFRKDSVISRKKFLPKSNTSSIIHAATTLAKLSRRPRSSNILKRIMGVVPRTSAGKKCAKSIFCERKLLPTSDVKLADLEDISSDEDNLPVRDPPSATRVLREYPSSGDNTASSTPVKISKPTSSRSDSFPVDLKCKQRQQCPTPESNEFTSPRVKSTANISIKQRFIDTDSVKLTGAKHCTESHATTSKKIVLCVTKEDSLLTSGKGRSERKLPANNPVVSTKSGRQRLKTKHSNSSSSSSSPERRSVSFSEVSAGSSPLSIKSVKPRSASGDPGLWKSPTSTPKKLTRIHSRKMFDAGKDALKKNRKRRMNREGEQMQGRPEANSKKNAGMLAESDSYLSSVSLSPSSSSIGEDSSVGSSSTSSSSYDEMLPASDVLPRLTRSQHRLLLGDTPPGAQLLTATAATQAPALEREASIVMRVNGSYPIDDLSGEEKEVSPKKIKPEAPIVTVVTTAPVKEAVSIQTTKSCELQIVAISTEPTLNSPIKLSGDIPDSFINMTPPPRLQSSIRSPPLEGSMASISQPSPLHSPPILPHPKLTDTSTALDSTDLSSLPPSPSSLWDSAVAGQEALSSHPGVSSRFSDSSVSSCSTEPMREVRCFINASLMSSSPRGSLAEDVLPPQLFSPMSIEAQSLCITQKPGVKDNSNDEAAQPELTESLRATSILSKTLLPRTEDIKLKGAKQLYSSGRRRRRVRSSSLSMEETVGVCSLAPRHGVRINKRQGLRHQNVVGKLSHRPHTPSASSVSTGNKNSAGVLGSPACIGNQISSPLLSCSSFNLPLQSSPPLASSVCTHTSVSGVPTTTGAVTVPNVTTGMVAASVRRFGGPFYPIANIDLLPSDIKCQKLQQSLHKILESWRSARQLLKDLDQRASRSRRLRARQRHTEATFDRNNLGPGASAVGVCDSSSDAANSVLPMTIARPPLVSP